MLDHVSIQVDDIAVASAFYDAVFEPLGYRRVMDFGDTIGYGDVFPAFWIGVRTDPIPNRQSHLAFQAPSRAAVDAFLATAVAAGAEVLHEPRVWPEYHPGYYGAFVRDPDGNNIEAVHHTFDS
ncbi:VOC family protein [Aquihabitans daechungensis]|uniref:VOC family protein n=1 Tax=Aquihabitans daechungensis TaxID=1052257 RepID=UPI003BA0A3BF